MKYKHCDTCSRCVCTLKAPDNADCPEWIHNKCMGCASFSLPEESEPCSHCSILNEEGCFEDHYRFDRYESDKRNAVNHPSHYNKGKIECIDAMVAAFGAEKTATFCLLNSFKYIWRAETKNGLEDIQKAEWYLNKYEELMKGVATDK